MIGWRSPAAPCSARHAADFMTLDVYTSYGNGHPLTQITSDTLADVYMNQGRWEEAEELFVQVIETRKTKLGAGYPNKLTSIANLASMYRDQGWWEEAEEPFV